MSEIDVEPVDDTTGDGDAAETDADADAGGSGDDASEEAHGEVPVEAVESALPEGVDAPEYVLYGGKGGVGKTTMAAATALSSAAGDVPTLVVSTDPAHSLSDTLDAEIPPTPSRIRDDMPLYAAEIDPDAAMDEGIFGGGGPDADAAPGPGSASAGAGGADAPLGGMGDLFGAMGGDDGPGPGFAGMAGSMPGADEAAAMRQLLEHLDDPRFDRVVIDTAPTGHTLRLLQLPEMLDSMAGRMVQLRERMGGMVDGVKGMFGMGGDAADGPGLDEMRDRIERLRAVLRDPAKTDFRVVMIPEEMSVVESERLVDRLDEFGIPVQTLVVNRVMEDLADVADGEVDSEWIVAPDLESCEFCQRRWRVQQNALRRATDLFRGREVARVPLLADEVRGEEALRAVAACLR